MLMDEGAEVIGGGGAAPAREGGGVRKTAPSLRQSAGLAWQRKASILLAALGCGGAALAFGALAEPRFTATAQLYIDPRDIQIVDRALTTNGQDGANNIAVVESQARVITSTAVLRRVVEAEHLMDDPEFTRSPGLAGTFERLGLLRPKPADAAGVTRALEERLAVHRPERTFVVDVTVRSNAAEKSARLANAVAEGYLAEESNARAAAARRASVALSGRLAELREAVRVAEDNVEQYRARHNLLGARGQLVTEQQLADVNAQLATARARVADAQARFDQIEAARRALRDTGATTEAVTSQTIGALRAQYAELRRRQAELTNELGARHPQLRSVESQARDVQRSITEEVGRITQAARADLDRARSLETSIARSLDGLKARQAETGQAQVQLRELEREAEASRNVYQAFLTRARETGEQEGLNSANARIITVAAPPKTRAYPPRLAILAALGALLGAALAAVFALRPAFAGAGAGASSPDAPLPDAPGPRPARRQRDQARPLPAPERSLPLIGRLTTADLVRHPPRPRLPGEVLDLTLIGLPVLRPSRSPSSFASDLRRWLDEVLAGQEPGRPRRIGVVGSDPASRRATALNLALAASRDGEAVLLVDADGALTQAIQGWERGARPPSAGPDPLVRQSANHVTVVLRPAEGSHDARQGRLTAALLGPSSLFDLGIIDGPALPAPSADGLSPVELDDVILVLPPGGEADAASLPEATRALLRGAVVAAFEAAPAPTPSLALVR